MKTTDPAVSSHQRDAYRQVRAVTERLASPLSAEDQTVQSMPDVSPTKWHRAHVTWFFETFILGQYVPDYQSFSDAYAYIFNSYYEAVGARHPRAERGLLSRPGIDEIARYRVHVDDAMRERIRAGCPELPFDKQRRFQRDYQIPYTLTSVLVADRELSEYFEEAARLCGKPQAAGNWIVNDLLRELGAARSALAEAKIRPAQIAALVGLVDSGAIVNQAAKEVFAVMAKTGESPEAIVAQRGLRTETNVDQLEEWCRAAIAADARALADFKAGKDSAINAFKGPVMKAAKGKASPPLVDATLRRLLAGG